MDDSLKKINEYFQILPDKMQEYVSNNNWSKKIESVSQVNDLTEEQLSDIKLEILLVLVGIENYTDLKVNIQKNIPNLEHSKTIKIVSYIEENIFLEVKPILVELEKRNSVSSIDKSSILHEIENPIPTKPIVPNPIGNNVVLDAQHNLPEQEKKILISSGAVPSKGPMLGNVKPTPAKYTNDPYREKPE